ncbi:hypothetical protein GWK47_045404 [Chionoecetes opilio]|uniref:Reverse transcriptase domain-containing protein n=1 Tax=Chionoecetes opilio TaxID=41210 RepID=A0A8J4YEV5_CHIOP|nr:hypothetical protein GWK47_045404 [Chionoecetes opilio]
MRRPRENAGYEEMRRDTNKRLQEEVVRMKAECSKDPGDYGVSFIDLDGALPQEVFEGDKVHLNWEGKEADVGRMLENGSESEAYRSGCEIGDEVLSVLMYADDVVILSENHNELQEMLNAVTEYGRDFNVRLSKEKSQVLVVNGDDSDDDRILGGGWE